MDMGIKGRVACVAGASQGLGRAVAWGLAAEGCDLAICARNEEALADLAGKITERHGVGVLYQALDLRQPGQGEAFTRRVAQDMGRLDILVTNGGGPPAGGFDDFSEDDWLTAVRLILLSAQGLARGALPAMRAQGWGRIVNLTSISVKQPLGSLILSNSLRAAVIGWAKTLSDEVGRHGVTVNNICQGWIMTDRLEEILGHNACAQGTARGQVLNQLLAGIPLGRIGRPEELADLAVFLASERAAYITGVSYLMDGGLHRGLM